MKFYTSLSKSTESCAKWAIRAVSGFGTLPEEFSPLLGISISDRWCSATSRLIIIRRQFKEFRWSRQVSQLKFKVFLTLFMSNPMCEETTTNWKVFMKVKGRFNCLSIIYLSIYLSIIYHLSMKHLVCLLGKLNASCKSSLAVACYHQLWHDFYVSSTHVTFHEMELRVLSFGM